MSKRRVKCHKPAVYFQRYSGRHLCHEHLVSDIEVRAKRIIRQQGGLSRGGTIGILSDGPGLIPLTIFLDRLLEQRKDLKIVLLSSSDFNLPQDLIQKEYQRIEISYQDLLGPDRDRALIKMDTIPGAKRLLDTYLVWKMGLWDESFRLIIPDILDETAEQVIFCLFNENLSHLLSDIHTGQIRVIRPFSSIPWEELKMYAMFFGIGLDTMYLGGTYREVLKQLMVQHPSVLFSLCSYARGLRSLLLEINPKPCQRCGWMIRGPCPVCQIIDLIIQR